MISAAFQEAASELAERAATIGIVLGERQRDQLALYAELLTRANQQINLTAIRTLDGVMNTLILDSLTVATVLPKPWLQSQGDALRLSDIGAGAGIPGIPLKIAFPSWQVTLIESIGKKARFIEEVIKALKLGGAEVISERVEEVGRRQQYRDSMDLVTARAVASLPVLLEFCAPLAASGGMLALPRSGDVSGEVSDARGAAKILNLRLEGVVPIDESLGLGSGRVVILYEKTGPTPGGYPRRVGLAKSRPIGTAPRASKGERSRGQGGREE